MSRIRLLLLLVAAFCWPGPQASARTLLEPATADQELVQELAREARVVTRPARPDLGEYVSDVSLSLLRWIADHLGGIGLGAVKVVEWLATVGWLALVAVLLLFLMVLLLLGLRRRLRRRASGESAPASEPAAVPAPEQAAVDWEQRLTSSLEAGDLAAALEALWWWLAARLVTTEVDPAWTNRELMLVAERPDLMPQARALDRMMYGARLPQAEDVRSLWGRLREALP